MLQQRFSLSFLLLSLVFTLFIDLSASATDTFIYGGCSQLRFTPGTPYASNINSIFTSLVNSASVSNFNNFKVSLPGSDIVYGLFQCRGDLSSSNCKDCVAHSVSRFGTICPESTGGVIQLEGCFVKYDNISFLGVEDKTEVLKRCGSSVGYNSDVLNHRDAELAYLTIGNGQYFRVGGSGSIHGMAQCVQDLSVNECQDCLSEASGRIRSECETSVWADMFLGKCYVRYSDNASHSKTDDGEVDKTLALTIGTIAGIALFIVFLSFLSNVCSKKGGK